MSEGILFPNKRYSVIYADPPWSYRQCGTNSKSRGTAAKHYSTMTTEDICAMPVQSICEPAAKPLLRDTAQNRMKPAAELLNCWETSPASNCLPASGQMAGMPGAMKSRCDPDT